MTTPETPPPGGDGPGRGLSGVQRAGIVLGALAVLLIVFVVLRGGDNSGGDSSSSAPQTTATQTATATTGSTSSGSTSTGSTSTQDSTTGSTTDDNGSGGGGSDDSGSGTTQTQPSTPAVQTIRVVNGQPQGGVERLEATKGDRVRFKVQSDVADEIHVHGYDLKKDVTAGGSATFSFTANIEGRFEIELENAGTQIAELEVKPS